MTSPKMSDSYDLLAAAVHAIRDSAELRELFARILSEEDGDRRVDHLLAELSAQSAPESIMKFVMLLRDDRIAAVVLREIQS